MTYKILKTFGWKAEERMEEQVASFLKEGWVPKGGAYPMESHGILTLYQTLVKTIKTAKNPKPTP